MNILEYLDDSVQIQLQILNKRFYQGIHPRCIYKVGIFQRLQIRLSEDDVINPPFKDLIRYEFPSNDYLNGLNVKQK